MNRFSKKIFQLSISRHWKIIGLIFILVQAALFYKIGVFTDLEAKKYIFQGDYLLNNGHLSDNKYFFYLPVILLVALCNWLNISYSLIVLIQVALSGFSLYCFYRLVYELTNKQTAFWSSLLIAVFFPLQIWNFYLYSDSIFISLTTIFAYLVYKFENKGIKGVIIILLFLIALILARPHGILFIPPVIIYLWLRKLDNPILKKISIGFSIAFIAIMLYALNIAFTGGEDMDAMKPFVEEHIICFVPLKPEGAKLDLIKTGSPVYQMFYYIIHNPGHFIRLSFLKLESFFNLTRNFYSFSHNLYLSVFLIPVYIFLIPGCFYFFRKISNFSIYLGTLLILYPLGSTFQCDDWHSRFAMVVMPYIFFLSCLGFYNLTIGIQKR